MNKTFTNFGIGTQLNEAKKVQDLAYVIYALNFRECVRTETVNSAQPRLCKLKVLIICYNYYNDYL